MDSQHENSVLCANCNGITTVESAEICAKCGIIICGKCGDFCANHCGEQNLFNIYKRDFGDSPSREILGKIGRENEQEDIMRNLGLETEISFDDVKAMIESCPAETRNNIEHDLWNLGYEPSNSEVLEIVQNNFSMPFQNCACPDDFIESYGCMCRIRTMPG